MNEENKKGRICIIGAGPAGCYLALMLSKRGFKVDILEKRDELEKSLKAQGRSINLVLCIRGITALKKIGLENLLETGVAIKGGALHNERGETISHFIIDPIEIDYSINRNLFNLRILQEAQQNENITISFNTTVFEIDVKDTKLKYYTTDNIIKEGQYDAIFGADGVHSTMKHTLQSYWGVTYTQKYNETQYIEMSVPPGENGNPKFAGDQLHMWPRKGFEIQGFPNIDNSLTLNLFMPKQGETSFDSFRDRNDELVTFFKEQFVDIVDKIPDLEEQIQKAKIGYLLETDIYPWSIGKCCLIGDSAHSMLPYFGQGLNTTLEDCLCLDYFLDKYEDDFAKAFANMQKIQHPNAVAAQELMRWFFASLTKPDTFFKYRMIQDYLREIYPSKFKAINHLIIHSIVQYVKIQKLIDIEKKLFNDLEQKIADILRIAEAKEKNDDVEAILDTHAQYYQEAWNNPIDYEVDLKENEEYIFDTKQVFIDKQNNH